MSLELFCRLVADDLKEGMIGNDEIKSSIYTLVRGADVSLSGLKKLTELSMTVHSSSSLT